jgi:glucokinase
MALYGGSAMRGGCVIGVDLGGTKLRAGVVDDAARIHHRTRRVAQGLDQPALLATAEAAVRAVLDASVEEVSAVGFGIPALIDPRRGVVTFCNHLPLDGLAFADVMSERLGLPVFADNDANVAMLAEHRLGAAQGTRSALMLTLGTGIGGGVVVDGQLYRGPRGAGAELGHIVVDLDGPPCPGKCPNRGCLEALVSGNALVAEAERLGAERPDSALGRAAAAGSLTGPVVSELAHAGDGAAREVVALIGRRLGAGVAGLVNAFDPEVVVIGGGVIALDELLLAPAREEAAARLAAPVRGTPIVAARFGDEAGMVGAAVLARESVARPAAAA